MQHATNVIIVVIVYPLSSMLEYTKNSSFQCRTQGINQDAGLAVHLFHYSSMSTVCEVELY